MSATVHRAIQYKFSPEANNEAAREAFTVLGLGSATIAGLCGAIGGQHVRSVGEGLAFVSTTMLLGRWATDRALTEAVPARNSVTMATFEQNEAAHFAIQAKQAKADRKLLAKLERCEAKAEKRQARQSLVPSSPIEKSALGQPEEPWQVVWSRDGGCVAASFGALDLAGSTVVEVGAQAIHNPALENVGFDGLAIGGTLFGAGVAVGLASIVIKRIISN